MADIILAEYNGNAWLVGGEDHIDDLLNNSLPATVTIELVACESKADIHALWRLHSGEPAETAGDPWLIHPGIVARIRRGAAGFSVVFQQWSAMIDAEAQGVIAAAVSQAAYRPEADVVLTIFLDPAGAPMMADLTRLRARLVEEKLVEAGLLRERIGRAEGSGTGAAAERIDLRIGD
jgi:hypothetical protein